MIMKKMLKTMSLGLLFVSPMMIGMEQGAAPAAATAAAPAPRINLRATKELGKLLEKEFLTTDDWTAIKLLLDRHADINAKNKFGFTTLIWAVYSNNKDMVRELLAHGADINVRNIYGRTALNIAQEGNNEDIIPLFQGALQQRMPQSALSPAPISAHAAAPAPRFNRARARAKLENFSARATAKLENLMEKSFRTTDDWTAIVRLLDRGADINVKNEYGWTVLMRAVMDNNIDMVELLLDHGADINAKDIGDDTALDFAQERKNQVVIKLLQDALQRRIERK